MSDIRGVGPTGSPLDISVTALGDVFVDGRVYRWLQAIPGIGTGAAYASGDAFGTSFSLSLPARGTISVVLFLDYDNEGLNKELVLFSRPVTETADNAAFAVSDAGLRFTVGVVSVEQWYGFANNQIGIANPALSYSGAEGGLYGQWVTRGADNIAAGAIPEFVVVVV